MSKLTRAWKPSRFVDMVTSAGATRKARGWSAADADVDRYVGLEHLDPNSPRIRRWASPEVVGENSDLRHFEAGDVILARRGIEQRKVGMAEFRGVASGHALVFRARPDVVLPEFLPYFLLSDVFMNRALLFSAGSLSKTVNLSALMKQEFGLPPLGEQRRFASLFHAATEARYSVDLAVVTASQTERAVIDDHVVRNADTFVAVDRLVRDSVLRAPQDGNHGARHPKASDYQPSGVPFLMASDVRAGKVDLVTCKFISQALADSLRPAFRAIAGDVLLTHKGTVGEVAHLVSCPTKFVMLTPQVTYYRVLAPERLLPEYVGAVLTSSKVQQQLAALGRQSTRAFISITTQLSIKIPFPSIEQQQQLVRQVAALRQATTSLARRAEEQRKVLEAAQMELGA